MTQDAQAAAATCVELASRVTIEQAQELKEILAASLANGESLIIDGSRVEQIDTAILQLLVSTWRSAAQRGFNCRWQAASEALKRSAGLIGVTEVLELAIATAQASGDAPLRLATERGRG